MTLMTTDDTYGTGGSGGDVRRTLAQRIAHRNRQRAERMARLHAGSGDVTPLHVRGADAGVARPDETHDALDAAITRTRISRNFDGGSSRGSDATAALNEFIDALQDGLSGSAASSAGMTRFNVPQSSARPAPVTPICDLDRLTGAGPGLIWALQRTGICSLLDMAALDPADLIDRLGILGRMIPAETWIRTARAATGHGH